jgi:hypothetical protein
MDQLGIDALGVARAKAEGITLGRPSIEHNAEKFEAIKAALAAKQGVRRIARELQTGRRHGATDQGGVGGVIGELVLAPLRDRCPVSG